MEQAKGGSLLEAVALAVSGAVLGTAVGSPLGIAIPIGAVAAINGAISGWRGIYDWRCANGPVAFVLDSTWATPMTLAALFSQAVAGLSKQPGYDASLSRRANRHVYQRGFMPRRGFAITLGNVLSGAGDTSLPHRQRLITNHENVHVWQARWFGPFFPVLYVGWMLFGVFVGVIVWLLRRRSDRLGKVIESCSYYINPFEWWAYSRANNWPPGGKVKNLGWRRPVVLPFDGGPVQ